ncbi:MAG TPA: S8 family serine peptidase [Solirubrobacteraceae bacterium]|nr:S8 family serine peptidase [Solirubrobacteraceae bacterium]
MSPNRDFSPENPLDSPLVERFIKDPSVVYDAGEDNVVIAMRGDLVVSRAAREASPDLQQELAAIAVPHGTIGALGTPGARDVAGAGGQGDADAIADVELWRLIEPERNALDEVRRLRPKGGDVTVTTPGGHELKLPAVAPNHVSVVSPKLAGCPAGPPLPAPHPRGDGPFVRPLSGPPGVHVVVIDTGYIATDPPHHGLDERVTSVPGSALDTASDPPQWVPDPPDAITTDSHGRLHEIVGHGTFIAGQIAHLCDEAAITVVGQRDQDILITGETAPEQKRLFSSEVALAHALLEHATADVDVVQLGFSFPTLDDYPSLPFARVMELLSGPDAPRPGVAVVTPAGNEDSAHPYWPAALPGVIGVAATNRRGRSKARFSNWGSWLDCCARGEQVVSAYIHWAGRVEGDGDEIEAFEGWARWDGTSFAAPKVSAAIARLVATEGLVPMEAFQRLVSGTGGVPVTQVTDVTLSGPPGVTLPQLHIRR